MQKEACLYIGFIAKKHGFKGQLSIKLDGAPIKDYNTLEYIYIEIEGQLIFHKIDYSSIQKKIFLKLKLEEVNDDDTARELIKKHIYVPKKNVSQLNNNNFFDCDIIGFKVQNKVKKYIGLASDINTSSMQNLLIVNTKKKEIMIPLVNNFIINLDKKNKIITVDLPDGLIDLN